MSRVSRFAARDPGPAARMSGFLAHLRENGLRLGVAETGLALQALERVNAAHPNEARRALKAVCASCHDESERFDDLFDSFWLNGGRVRRRIVPASDGSAKEHVHSSRKGHGEAAGGSGQASAPDGGQGEAECDGLGKLVATDIDNLMRMDLRDLVRPEDIAEAERVARYLGAALRDTHSRRRRPAPNGDRLHFRNVIRRSLATGGEPLVLARRKRPDRVRKITAICDVSGSMRVYSQIFLAFLAGLMRADPATDTYLFHTRLVRITDALREKDALRGLARLSLMADGFGGGSKIGGSLAQFTNTYSRRHVDGRTVVLILSDGYDTDPPVILSDALARLRRRGCRIIWLNPLKGWDGYEPVTRSMAAALPHLDLFRSANRLEHLSAIAPELIRL